MALTLAVAPFANAALININFTGFTGGTQGPAAETGLAGPAGGFGSTWNQYKDEDTSGTLLDGADNTYRHGLNGIQINLVPEPNSIALLALGGIRALRRRRG